MRKISVIFLSLLSLMVIPIYDAYADNPNLFVSAENSKFENHFAGSMVIEVVIRDSSISDTDEGKGEPDVTLNGKTLRMVQATDGNWYAYFANVGKAKIADSTVPMGAEGTGLDFGVFCDRDTTILGPDFSDTDGVSIPRSGGLVFGSFTNGIVSFSSCTGTLSNSENINNVVRKAKSINTNSPLDGQIGLDPLAWPLIQLYSFDDVTIQYNPGGGVQQVDLEYDDIPNISLEIDRDNYPQNSEVFLTINDVQLNQDPTDEDSWTFNVESPTSIFYQAYDNNGRDSANGDKGLVDLGSNLSSLGFKDNGILSLELGNIIELTTNSEQSDTSVSDGTKSFSQIVTLVEEGPYSGLFDTADHNDHSTIKIKNNAPRGETGRIEYNEQAVSVLSGFSTATVSFEPSLSIGDGSTLRAGTEFPVILEDKDQNSNSGSRDDLDIFNENAIIPTLEIGNPITLELASDVKFYEDSTDNLITKGDSAGSSVPDKNSDRLIIDTSSVSKNSFEKISFNLGISASKLQSILIDSANSNSLGTNWVNYDLQSFENELGITDFSDTSIELSFGSLGSSPITIVSSGQMSSNGLVQISDSDVQTISSRSGTVYAVINFDSSNDSFSVGDLSNAQGKQPIVMDFFSFGLENNAGDGINNSIYRFELEETSDNSSIFQGTLEYAVANQLNILDPAFIQTIRTIDDEIKFFVTDRLIDEEGISINYSDLDEVGVVITTSTKSDIRTSSGRVLLDSTTFRFGQPVTFTLIDQDLNLKSDRIDTYQVIDNPNSPNVDTIGKDGNILLEILIKDIRYKRCTINGVETGGLASTGFSLVETGYDTGIFEGVFKMPSQICDKSGSKLISTAGGSLDAKYYDARDASGEPNIFRLSGSLSSPYSSSPELSETEVSRPVAGTIQEITLSGKISNPKSGVPLLIELQHPDGVTQNFSASLVNGNYKAMFSINENSLSGKYIIRLSHSGLNAGTISFTVLGPNVPDWVKNNAKWWSTDVIPDSEFIDGLEDLITKGVIRVSPSEKMNVNEKTIPGWVKTTAKWWSDDQISNDDFLLSIEYLIKKGIIRI